ncbi:lactococcin 972 family bacteriocin [Lactobacillus sp. ESL0681]|uniref:lactococcin 972 family bacteriocin n=1 Tax=Lactobacillus sp. ESL0681 TaxID=2983211 RepID=UPI0023F746EF|nr:lactococcin 972 family bacteriocin [Lactobacillus sp. ESL0681]WEV40464.1 lactococcin 972 family bacteriocin [Lactobacillus sp. ESL0681]
MKSLKKIAVSLATVATIGMTAVPAFAASENDSVAETHMVSGDSPLLLARTTSSASGGTWKYDVGSTYVWSYYYHKTKTHKASVKAGDVYITSGWTKKGKWAKASAKKAFPDFRNSMYYDVK